MDTQQRFIKHEDPDQLRTENLQLKKELETEKTLHAMLYKEWKQLSEQMDARNHEAYENARPKNLFYKYAFFVLLAAAIPAGYWAYSHIPGRAKIPSSFSSLQVVSDSASNTTDSTPAKVTAPVNELPSEQKSLPAKKEGPSNSEASKQPTAISQPISQPKSQPAEKKATPTDSAKQVKTIPHKALIEKPLTDDERDSISSDGFSAYFDHRRNPFRRSSQRYKVWAEGWNQGKAEAIKVLEKNPSLKH